MSADDTRTRFSVRISYSDDSDGVSELLQASYSSLFGPAYSTDVLCQALAAITRANPRLLESGAFFVAEADHGQIVGCGGWSFDYPGTENVAGTGQFRHFATHPDWLRRGVGRALLSETVSQAADRGIRTLECQSSLVASGVLSLPGIFGNRPEHVAPDVRRRHSERTHAEVHCVMSACPHSAEGPQ